MKAIIIFGIQFYQRHLRKLHNRKCIYDPSCSTYAILAIRKYGALKGCYYGYSRIRRCNGALFQGGVDYP